MMWLLFLVFMQIGFIGFGGGYAILPLIQDFCVKQMNWITLSEFSDLVTISQLTPGPILINSATFIGNKIGGVMGAVSATVASVLPSIIIVVSLSALYYRHQNLNLVQLIIRFLKPLVTGLIMAASVSILLLALFNGSKISFDSLDLVGFIMVILAFIALRKFKVNPLPLIASYGVIMVMLYYGVSYFSI